MNPFATPDGSAAGGSVAGSGSGSATIPAIVSGPSGPESSVGSVTESQPTLRDFPHPPSKNPLRAGRPPRAVAWSDKRSIISTKEKYTFYREGTPPPPEDRITQPPPIAEHPEYDYKYDHIAPPAPIPVATVCGVRRRVFWPVLAAVIIVIALAVGIGVGVGVGTKQDPSSGASDAQTSGIPEATATSTLFSSSSTTSIPASATTTSSDTEPKNTGPASTQSTTASTISSNPAITTLVSCPAANNTIFKVPGTDKEFVRICGVDYTGKNSAVDLAHAWTPTFEDCMVYCAGIDECEGCGWGILKGDPGSYHRCWLKGSLKSSRSTRVGWDFAILRDK